MITKKGMKDVMKFISPIEDSGSLFVRNFQRIIDREVLMRLARRVKVVFFAISL